MHIVHMLDGWKNISIVKKLHFIIGLMGVLIACELLTLQFAMQNLSAARAFVGGESLWSKAQKNAVFSLQQFAVTRDEKDYEAYLKYLEIPEGDRRARVELFKSNPDKAIIKEGFLAGHIHVDDIEPMVKLLQRFYWISYLNKAIEIWTKGDELILELKAAGQDLHTAVLADDKIRTREVINRVKSINEEITVLEEDFSFVLGQGSRWLESLVLSILAIAVLTVESIGLTFAFLISRRLSIGLQELSLAAKRIGQGDFSQIHAIRSSDEIGQLGHAINHMGLLVRNFHCELEGRVEERTAELEKMVEENALLYKKAQEAVDSRDEFLSIASHELRTPLTSLFLQLQILLRTIRDMGKPGLSKLELSKPELSKQGVSKPELSKQGVSKHELFKPELSQFELLQRESSVPVLPKSDLVERDLPKADLPKADLFKADLAKVDLPRADSKIELSKTELSKIEEMTTASVNLARRITILLNELLDLTRLGIGKFVLYRQQCNLTSIVQYVVSQLEAEAARAGSSIRVDAPDSVKGDFDEMRIGQVLTNLLSNAIKYGNGKPIDIVVQDNRSGGFFGNGCASAVVGGGAGGSGGVGGAGGGGGGVGGAANSGGGAGGDRVNGNDGTNRNFDGVVIYIRDRGQGIPHDQQKSIFERFGRGTNSHVLGLGLGLYISNQIVKAHGGTISVESDGRTGSTFTVLIK